MIKIIKLEDTKEYTIYGKTGLSKWDNSGISWFVGFVEVASSTKGKIAGDTKFKGVSHKVRYTFAFNAVSKSLEKYTKTHNLPQRVQIEFVKEYLEAIGFV